jgi:hypothetical protein
MAATRLSDSQKSELLSGFRAGESTQALADRFGCSPNTVIRVAKSALGADDYEQLKRHRLRGGPEPAPAVLPPDPAAVEPAPPSGTEAPEPVIQQASVAESHEPLEADEPDQDPDDDEESLLVAEADLDDDVALDVDSEYGDDDDDLIDDDEDVVADDGDPDLNAEADPFSFQPIAVLGFGGGTDAAPAQVHPLASAQLPASVYMLVDKVVELQAKPLSDMAELGQLPPEEHHRQALVVFTNPRQAKRVCGRNQRVIKLPDTRVIERTAPYLLAQGISRVVIEGALYALPGS